MDDIRFRIPDLSILDVEALRAMAPADSFEVETPKSDPRQMNELTAVAVICGVGLLSSAAAYLFGKRRSEDVELDVEAMRKDGSAVRIRLRVSKRSTEPVDTQIMSQIKAALDA